MKSIKIHTLIEEANAFFLNSADDMASQRVALQHFVSGLIIRHARKSYQGFRYLREEETNGKTFGVKHEEGKKPVFFDESRIAFYQVNS